ncbi:MAG: DUF6502 family protein [Burkholderiales bacterium]
MTAPPPKRPRPSAAPAATSAPDPAALTQAMRELMGPVARLAIAQGLSFAAMEEMLKTAFVDAARAAHTGLPAHRLVSRISTATGINRREVSRITQAEGTAPVVRDSPATRLFTKWIADPALRLRGGALRALPRSGPAPSFEALAQSVTRDVHPRSLLDELCRLGLARLDGETVHVVRESVVPGSDSTRMLDLLGNNVGDHLRAAVANVLSREPLHLEQAIFAELSVSSMERIDLLMRAHWKSLLASTVPALQQLIDDDRGADRVRDQRVRIGLYTYHETTTPAADTAAGAQRPRAPTGRRKK